MAAGSKLSRLSLKSLLAAAAFAGLSCGGKTIVILGTSPDDAATGTEDVASSEGGAAGGMIGCPIGGCTVGPSCPPGVTTSVSGKVFDPAGKTPLYNVIVYNPSTELDPIPDGLQCGQCDGKASGNPVVAKLTSAAGTFLLDDVIVNPDSTVTIVTQIGKWRRKTSISVKPCQPNAIPDGVLHLPRNADDGDLPRIAVTTGHSDALECLLLKIGIDGKQFTTRVDPDKKKHVHMYVGCPNGSDYGASKFDSSLGSATFPDFKTLLGDDMTLKSYDMIVMSCEGTQCGSDKRPYIQAVKDYADKGGRLFLEHDHKYWLKSGYMTWPMTAQYLETDTDNLTSPFTSKIDSTFPKGKAFSEWFSNVGGSLTPGTISIYDARFSVIQTLPPQTQQWIYTDQNPLDPSGMAVQYMTMNTPVEQVATPEKQCGRVTFTDVHVVSDPMKPSDVSDAAHPFPSGCSPITSELTPHEKALEFMLFDLSSCVLSEKKEPEPPAIIR